jgi:hypothetical protein
LKLIFFLILIFDIILKISINEALFMSIIISKKGQNAKILEKSDFERENNLQEYIHNNPESIPIYELKEDKKLYVAKREFPTTSGPIDALAFDKDGDIYIIETKLFKNYDKRNVIAQVLDYGAAIWKHFTDFSRFLDLLNQESQKNFNINFQEKIESFFDITNDQSEIILDAISNNLNNGNINFIIVMDSIDERLKDLILYINQNSYFDIYAVNFEYYKFECYEIIIPKIFGVEVKKKISDHGKAKQWDRKSFMEEMRTKIGIAEEKITTKLLNWAKNMGLEPFWSKTVNAHFHLIMRLFGSEYKIFSVSTELGGRIWVRFGDYSKYPPFDDEKKREELLRRLNSIGLSISSNQTITKSPGIILSYLKDESIFQGFIEIYEWFIKEIKDASKLQIFYLKLKI